MGFPGRPSSAPKNAKYNSAETVAIYLKKHHENKFMVFNLSDEIYETMLFEEHVIPYDLYGMPSPSLGMILKICINIETFLKDDPENVAVIHCLVSE